MQWLPLIGISLLSLIVYMDFTIVNTALPAIQIGLNATITELQWIINAYVLSIVALSAVMGRLSDIIGLRLMLYISVIIFGIASLCAGFTQSIKWLIFYRGIQGIGCAMLLPVSFSLVSYLYRNTSYHSKAIAFFSMFNSLGLSLGPVVGGFVVSFLDWRYIFFLNIPIIVIGLWICTASVKEIKGQEKNIKIDWIGAILLSSSTACLVLGILNTEIIGFNRANITLFTLFIICAILFIFQEKRFAAPLIDLSLFVNPYMLLIVLGSVLCGGFAVVVWFITPLYLVNIRHLLPYMVGLVMLASPITQVISSVLCGHIMDKVGPCVLMVITGLFWILTGLICLGFDDTLSFWWIVFAMMTSGIPTALMNIAPTTAISKYLPKNLTGMAIGCYITFWNIGSIIILAVSTALFQVKEKNILNKLLAEERIVLDVQEQKLVISLIYNPDKATETMAKFPYEISNKILSIFKNSFINSMYITYSFLIILSLVIVLLSTLIYQKTKIKC